MAEWNSLAAANDDKLSEHLYRISLKPDPGVRVWRVHNPNCFQLRRPSPKGKVSHISDELTLSKVREQYGNRFACCLNCCDGTLPKPHHLQFCLKWHPTTDSHC